MGKGNAQRSGAGLARLRIAAGLSRRQLADAAHLATETVCKAEAGRGVRDTTAEALASVLGEAVYDVIELARPREVVAGRSVVRPVLAARYDRRWTRVEAARKLGVHEDVLMRLEHGRTVLPANALKVAEGYGLDVFELVPDPTKEDSGTPVAA